MGQNAYFLKVAGVTGESQNAVYSQWTDLLSFSFGVTGSGHGGSGTVNVKDVSCMALVDSATPAIFLKCANGDRIPKIEIAGAKMGGEQVEYARYVMEQVYVSSVQMGGQGPDSHPIAQYTFNFAKITFDYKKQTQRGTVGGASTGVWDINQLKQ